MGNPNHLISLLPPKVREAIQLELDAKVAEDLVEELFEKPRKEMEMTDRTPNISAHKLDLFLKKHGKTCCVGRSLEIETDMTTGICKPFFLPAANDGTRNDAEQKYLGPYAVVHCSKCGHTVLYFLPNVLRTIEAEENVATSQFARLATSS